MNGGTTILARVRRRYAAKLAVGLGAIVTVTVAFVLIIQLQIQGRPTGAEVTSSILRMILIVVISFGLLGVTIGTNTAITLRQLAARAETMAEGDLDVSLETPREDGFGTLHAAFDEMQTSLQDRIEEAEAAKRRSQGAKERAERRRAEAEALSEHLEATAADYSEVMGACAEGDLTRQVDPDGESEAIIVTYLDLLAKVGFVVIAVNGRDALSALSQTEAGAVAAD
jgi:methyl-accepting chemotaxis protein